MTALNNSQLLGVAVGGGSAPIAASQLSGLALLSNPSAAGLNASLFGAYAIVANGKKILPLGPVIPLPCWQPCTAYGTEAVIVRFNSVNR